MSDDISFRSIKPIMSTFEADETTTRRSVGDISVEAFGPTQFSDTTLHGFWRGESATPSPVKLVKGDQQQFNADLERCKGRQRARLNKIQGNRFMVAHTWPEEVLLVDKWCDASVISELSKEDTE